MSGADWVLKRPGKADRALLDEVVETAADAAEMMLSEPIDAVMNRYNS
jgi:peptidyl-tRNA hydrolase